MDAFWFWATVDAFWFISYSGRFLVLTIKRPAPSTLYVKIGSSPFTTVDASGRSGRFLGTPLFVDFRSGPSFNPLDWKCLNSFNLAFTSKRWSSVRNPRRNGLWKLVQAQTNQIKIIDDFLLNSYGFKGLLSHWVLEALALLKDFLKMIEKANLLTKNVVLHSNTSRHTWSFDHCHSNIFAKIPLELCYIEQWNFRYLGFKDWIKAQKM